MSQDPVNLKKLKAEWYAKLKDSGFNDLETEEGELKAFASSNFAREVRNGRLGAMKSSEEYYRAAGHFLWEHAFDNEIERKIWQMHSNGIPSSVISKTLNIPRKGRRTINQIVTRLAAIMGVKCRS